MSDESTLARRPRSIEEMAGRLKEFRTAEALDRGLSVRALPDDVFISTYPKSGTTWLQQVVHGLRSRGAMDFDEISAVVPWLESALDIGIDPHADQPWSPRAFKAHLVWERLPKGGRYITAFRDPKSVLASYYRFFEGWFFEPGSISLDAFAREWFMAGTAPDRYWDHIRSWAPRVTDDAVLALTYEDMVARSDALPAVVASFLDLTLDADTLALVTRQSSREFMARHIGQFDDHLLREARDDVWGLPPGSVSDKVLASATETTLDEDLVAELDALWRREIERELGFRDYDAFRASLPDPLGART